jgi:hypothetical protein
VRNKIQSRLAQPEKQAAPSGAISTPVPTRSQRAFLVVVLDEADGTASPVIVHAEHYEAAEEKAVALRKAENDLSDLDDEAAGFRAVASYSREQLANFLREMELPEPNV